MIRIRTVLAGVLIPAAVVLALAAPAAAHPPPHHHAAGLGQPIPVMIVTRHGHPHPWAASVVDPFKAGDLIRNGATSFALPVFWHNIGQTSYGMPIGDWRTSLGKVYKVIAANGTATHPDCGSLVIKDKASDFGTVTGWLFGANGQQWFATRACQNGGPWSSSPPKIVWGTSDGLATVWNADISRTQPPPGALIQFTTVPDDLAKAHTTALVQPATRQCQWIIGHSKWGGAWFEGRFSKNTCEETIRGFTHCQEGRSLQLRTGGWVEPSGKWSKATCLPGWSLKGGGVDVKCETCSAYHRYWVTGDFAFDVPAAHYIGGAQPSTVAMVKRACKLAYTITQNTSDIFEIKFTQTCGLSYRAWRRWGGSDYDLGTYRKCPGCSSNYSTACDVTSCQSHPDGAPFCYGYQDKSTGVRTTLGGCSHRKRAVTLAVAGRHRLALAA